MTKKSLPPGGLLLLPLIACLVTLTGCGASPDVEAARTPGYEGAQPTMVGIDVGPGGQHITVAESAAGTAGGKLQVYSAGQPRSQSFASFADAVPQWERKAPQLVVIGEAWARLHGIPASWVKELQRLGVKQGRKPRLAVVEGTAEDWLRSRPPGPEGGMIMLGPGSWTAAPLSALDYRYGDDLVLPYLPASAVARWTPDEEKASPQALLFTNQKLVATLSSDQSQLLSCLRGGDLPQLVLPGTGSADSASGMRQELRQVSCSTDIAANGDLKHPRLRVITTIEAKHNGQASARQWEERVKRQGEELLRSLQELRTDPLRMGEAVRRQYGGMWTQERWREAMDRAEVTMDVKVILLGGA